MQIIRRAEYTPPAYQVKNTQLHFSLDPQATLVKATLTLSHQEAKGQSIHLHGDSLALVSVSLNGQRLSVSDYQLDDNGLTIFQVPKESILETECRISPKTNLAFSGLYLSNNNFFTQCEAEGFRRITFFPDRPDVMSRYQVYLEAPQASYPVLLSNGNLVNQGLCSDKPGWHWALWDDPFAKPSYLFALVAGRFVATEQTIAKASGKPALLQVWVEPGNEDKTAHAMQSLVHAIRWDERRFGLELDLDRFMIVASADFNMGAMENKGLNIFNTKYVFANPRIATDMDFEGVEAVVGHEYFHNWTGNRVTCRDWFQLTLKEGLTVFRDQEFTADRLAEESTSPALAASARAVKRIDDVRVLRASQFAEDAGPMAHPIRPESYSEINNFYTVTVYEKGAEVIRMLQTLLGVEGFRKGMDLYFARHDGQAVTCDDFVAAMADANQRDLSLFSRWYSQVGTPRLQASWHFVPHSKAADNRVADNRVADNGAGTLTIRFTQSLPALLIPIAIGALNASGRDLLPSDALFELGTEAASLELELAEPPRAVSLLRNFSAPVYLQQNSSHQSLQESLSFLAAHDTDPFNRWDAGQQLASQAVLAQYECLVKDQVPGEHELALTGALIKALAFAMAEGAQDPAYLAVLLSLPGETLIAEQITGLEPALLRRARNAVMHSVAQALAPEFERLYATHANDKAYQPSPAQSGKRALRAVCLTFLAQHPVYNKKVSDWATQQFANADNMTDQWAALSAVIHTDLAVRSSLLSDFESHFHNEALVMDKWFSAQASSQVPAKGHSSVLETVRALMQREDFSLTNPNRTRALVHSFCANNPAQFHRADGLGYAFWEEMVLAIDAQNPQVAARLARAMDRWKKFAPHLQELMQQSLNRLNDVSKLSPDVREVVAKALQA